MDPLSIHQKPARSRRVPIEHYLRQLAHLRITAQPPGSAKCISEIFIFGDQKGSNAMKLLIFSDAHGDLPAVQAALAHAERMGCALIVCAGDLVDGDVFAEELIALLIERSIPTVRGNHDRWAVGAGRAIEPHGELSSAPYDASGHGLSRAAVRYLAKMPTRWETTVDDLRIVMWHGRPGDDMRGVYPDLERADISTLLEAAGADVLLLGHTHEAFVATLGDRRLIANPGSLWQDAGGTFGVLDTKSCQFDVYRVNGERVEIPRRVFF